MTNLIKADFRRLFKSVVFYICAGLMLLLGIALPLIHYFTFKDYPAAMSFDSNFTFYSVAAVIVLAAFTALFIGTDHSDGTMRNKLIAGHKRSAVYLSELLAATCVGLILCAVYLAVYILIGHALIGEYSDGRAAMVQLILASLAMTAAFASVFTLISMLCTGKARSAVLCLICAILLLYCGILVSGRLHEPEFYSTYSLDPDGNVIERFDDPNPNYVSGNARKVLLVINDLNPGGQAVGIFTKESDDCAARYAAYDLLVFAAASGIGIALFKRKDLK